MIFRSRFGGLIRIMPSVVIAIEEVDFNTGKKMTQLHLTNGSKMVVNSKMEEVIDKLKGDTTHNREPIEP